MDLYIIKPEIFDILNQQQQIRDQSGANTTATTQKPSQHSQNPNANKNKAVLNNFISENPSTTNDKLKSLK
jgi:hypothetical protein